MAVANTKLQPLSCTAGRMTSRAFLRAAEVVVIIDIGVPVVELGAGVEDHGDAGGLDSSDIVVARFGGGAAGDMIMHFMMP